MTELTVFEPYQRLSMLIHAHSKLGKSTLSATAPGPILVLDAEGSWRFIPVTQIYWNPAVGPPPVYDGTWDVCIVSIRDWNTIRLVYDWLTQSDTCFASLVIDSITEVQRRCKTNLKGTEAMRIQDWGVLLATMDSVIRGFRDLTLNPDSKIRCVVFISESRPDQKTGQMTPYMQGQISISLPYWVDICGYLYSERDVDQNGQPTVEIRRLWIGPHPNWESGERVQGRLGDVLVIPRPAPGTVGTSITDWMKTIYGIMSTTTVNEK